MAIFKDQLKLWINVNNSKFKDWIKKSYLFIILIDSKIIEFGLTHFQPIRGLDIKALPEIHKLSQKSLSWHFPGNFDNFQFRNMITLLTLTPSLQTNSSYSLLFTTTVLALETREIGLTFLKPFFQINISMCIMHFGDIMQKVT